MYIHECNVHIHIHVSCMYVKSSKFTTASWFLKTPAIHGVRVLPTPWTFLSIWHNNTNANINRFTIYQRYCCFLVRNTIVLFLTAIPVHQLHLRHDKDIGQRTKGQQITRSFGLRTPGTNQFNFGIQGVPNLLLVFSCYFQRVLHSFSQLIQRQPFLFQRSVFKLRCIHNWPGVLFQVCRCTLHRLIF